MQSDVGGQLEGVTVESLAQIVVEVAAAVEHFGAILIAQELLLLARR